MHAAWAWIFARLSPLTAMWSVVEMMLDATRHYDPPLTAGRLHTWHASVFSTGRSGMARITVGA